MKRQQWNNIAGLADSSEYEYLRGDIARRLVVLRFLSTM